ncbi:hypothetical protein [Azospirillum sp. BE72]|uniref:hypothetical protein n=1 Tax=Azospirillum sp. BE72 TaxID=2817776 RepID=UPI00285CCC71|nr:hypothetical protein [Azospirillum sp. BE72]MDR6774268.1 hypothetical protein [Azospirillum sp. BE72]
MFVLSQAQMDRLGEEDLIRAVHRYLADRFPDADPVPADRFLAFGRDQLARAEGYGLTTRWQAACYIVTAALAGDRFDEDSPAAREVLADPAMTADRKAEWLTEWVDAMIAALSQRD